MSSLKLLNIAQRINVKFNEIQTMKVKRRLLFSDTTANESQIISLHYEVEFKKLELMYMKQEQIAEMTNFSNVYERKIYQQQLKRLNSLNEKCISLLLKRLFEEGYGQELKKRGLIKEHITASSFLSQSSM